MADNITDQEIYLRKDGHIAWLTINRPAKKNAINCQMWQAIPQLVDQAEDDNDIKLLILCSSTDSVFCAGADISEFDLFMTDLQARDQNRKAIRAACAALENYSRPTLAMIGGNCIGGGCILALSCDIRFSDSRARFGITPAKLGLVYGLSDTRRLMDQVGSSAARDILYSARIIDAERALQIGLITELFSPETLEQEIRDYAEILMRNSPHSLSEIKKMITRIQGGIRDDDGLSEKIFTDAFDGKDHKEGVDAFLNKRKPNY